MVAPTSVLIQPPQSFPRLDHPVPAVYIRLTRNSGQRRRENKKNRSDLSRSSCSSSNPIQSDQVLNKDDLQDDSSITYIIPSLTPNIAPPLLLITTIPHTATSSPSNSPNKLHTEPTSTDIIQPNLPPTKKIKTDTLNKLPLRDELRNVYYNQLESLLALQNQTGIIIVQTILSFCPVKYLRSQSNYNK